MNTTEQVHRKSEFNLSRQVSTVLADRSGKPTRLMADKNGSLPTEFELLKVGMWRTPNHGDIMITPDDLQAYYDNWKAGYGVSGNGTLKLPINFGHNYEGKAAGWFGLEVREDTLWAVDVEWSQSGKDGLLGDEWKCISAEFWPAGRGGWPDPLDYDHWVDNVVDGAALTNIPLFSQLKPVMASATSGKNDEGNQVFFITASQDKESHMATLEEVRVKKLEDLTEEEKNLITENKDKLTAEEQKAFGLEVTAEVPAPTPAPEENKDNPQGEETVSVPSTEIPAAVAASLRSGDSVVVDKKVLASLQETNQAYRTEKAEGIVKAHIERGAIKADQLKVWTEKLVSASTKERAELEGMLTNLNGNASVSADTLGIEGGAELEERDLIAAKAQQKISAARAEGKTLDIKTAMSQVREEMKNAEEAK